MTSYVREKLKQRINEEADKNEIENLGEKIAKAMKWDGADILAVCEAALREANFRTEAKKINQMAAAIRDGASKDN